MSLIEFVILILVLEKKLPRSTNSPNMLAPMSRLNPYNNNSNNNHRSNNNNNNDINDNTIHYNYNYNYNYSSNNLYIKVATT